MMKIICGTTRIKDTKEFLTRLNNISKKYDATLQAIDADLIAGIQHITFAAEKAIQSFNEKNNTSNNLAMETLLYIAGTRQIEKALQFGIKTGHNHLALLIISQHKNNTEQMEAELTQLLSEDPQVVNYTASKKERIISAFNITPEEIHAVGEDKIPKLVCERVALANLGK
jgi:KEOPS complex subunit Cgi121